MILKGRNRNQNSIATKPWQTISLAHLLQRQKIYILYADNFFNQSLEIQIGFCYKFIMKKNSFFVMYSIFLLSMLASIVAAGKQDEIISPTGKNPLITQQQEKKFAGDWQYQFSKYTKIYSLIKEYYPGEYDKEKIFFSSIESFLRSLDPHSYFLDPLSMRAMNEDQQGNYYGIGTRITKYDDRLTVVAALEGTPAFRLGIRAGDVVVEINGNETREMSLDDAMKKLRGAKGTTVDVKIKREGIEKLLSFSIPRAEIPLDSISYAVMHPVEPGICCINIRTFGSTTATELENHINDFIHTQNLKALILDLRWNVGGSLFAAIDVSELFLEKGKTIVSIKGRKISRAFVAEKSNQFEHIPLVILINRVSASASEIVAAAVQDHNRGTIIGTRSWGKGLVQTVYKLPMNSCVALTSAKYYTPGNRCLQRDFSNVEDYYSVLTKNDYDTDNTIEGGVQPDIIVHDKPNSDMIIEFVSSGVFFRFARHYLANLQGAAITRDFKVTPGIIQQFESFLSENQIEYDKKQFNRDEKTISENIEREVISNQFSLSEGFRVFLKTDPVTQKAVEVLKNPAGGKF